MPAWLSYTVFAVVVVLASTALFFFTLTRGALVLRGAMGQLTHDAAHVYPIYSNMRLIRLVDWQPVISAILLFQYSRLVSIITHGLRQDNLLGKQVLITSCAFGNVIPRVVKASVKSGACKVLIADIIQNELDHAQTKLANYADHIVYAQDNAVALQQPDASVHANVMFFLLHELPHPLKIEALNEAVRVLALAASCTWASFTAQAPGCCAP